MTDIDLLRAKRMFFKTQMFKINIIIFIIFIFSFKVSNAQINRIIEMNIERSLIAKGDNLPDFNIQKDSMDIFLIALHQGFSIRDFQGFTKFDDEKINSIISLLETKNFLHKIDNSYKPTVFIVNAEEGELLYKYGKPLSRSIVKSIKKEMPEIKAMFSKTDISKNADFEDWSFLILSNVLLDSWQIDNVEKYFLKKEKRPLRNGKNYYYSIMENTNPKTESFGIYGNHYQSIENGQYLCVYGNNRNNFNDASTLNIINSRDYEIFNQISELYLPSLLEIFESKRKYCKNIYTKLAYNEEISFEEFFIWWYHLIYTQATDEMNRIGMLKVAESGNFSYLIR